MLSSAEVAKRMKAFHMVEDVVSAMKAYAGVTVRKTGELVPRIREYERNMLSAIADIAAHYGAGLLKEQTEGKRILVAFGSSVGLCGAYNEKMADAVSDLFTSEDALFIVGRRLKSSLDLRQIPYQGYDDSVTSVNGIQPALKDILSKIMNAYGKEEYYDVTLVFTYIPEKRAEISVERILPPTTDGIVPVKNPPLTYMEPGRIFDSILEEFIYISLYRCYVESLRSENWYRLRSMEGASESLRKHLAELGSLQRYIGQEEITEEMLEILGSGMFYGT